VDETTHVLISRLRAGDSTAIGEYVESHRPQLLAYIERRLGPELRSRIESDDILQELSVDALQRIGDLAHPDRDPFGWFCQLAEHRLIDAHRKLFGAQKRSANREVGFDAPGDADGNSPLMNLLIASLTSPSQAFSRDQRELQLHGALEALPEINREALRLRYVENLATRDIAERLGKTDASIRVMLSRTIAQLREMFEGPA
jgi:RNA polymerase sigma-70 factor (ECF subfamily)